MFLSICVLAVKYDGEAGGMSCRMAVWSLAGHRGHSVFAPIFPGEEIETGYTIETYSYDLRGLQLPEDEVHVTEEEKGDFTWLIIVALIAAAVGGFIYYRYRKKKRLPDELG